MLEALVIAGIVAAPLGSAALFLPGRLHRQGTHEHLAAVGLEPLAAKRPQDQLDALVQQPAAVAQGDLEAGELGGPADELRIFDFHVDYNTPANLEVLVPEGELVH